MVLSDPSARGSTLPPRTRPSFALCVHSLSDPPLRARLFHFRKRDTAIFGRLNLSDPSTQGSTLPQWLQLLKFVPESSFRPLRSGLDSSTSTLMRRCGCDHVFQTPPLGARIFHPTSMAQSHIGCPLSDPSARGSPLPLCTVHCRSDRSGGLSDPSARGSPLPRSAVSDGNTDLVLSDPSARGSPLPRSSTWPLSGSASVLSDPSARGSPLPPLLYVGLKAQNTVFQTPPLKARLFHRLDHPRFQIQIVVLSDPSARGSPLPLYGTGAYN